MALTTSGQLLTDGSNHAAKVGQGLAVCLIKAVKTNQFGGIEQMLFSLAQPMNNDAKPFLLLIVELFTALQFTLPFPGIIQHQLFDQSLSSRQHSGGIVRDTGNVVFSLLVKRHGLKFCPVQPLWHKIRATLRLL